MDEKLWEYRLGASGPLARLFPGFRPRPQQQAMAARVASLLEQGGVGLLEAGTGTGKSFAYLLPALHSGRKVLVSTGSRALQDQILEKDLPVLLETMPQKVRAVRLKGRGNYLCHYRLGRVLGEGVPLGIAGDLRMVADWAGRSREGDIAELAGIGEDSAVWPMVTSTRENCLGSECPDQGKCHVLEARRRAQEAELVVVNHHLLLSDLALKAEGRGDLLPRADAVIVDEAHQLADLASQYLGRHLGAYQILEWVRDTRDAMLAEAADDSGLLGACGVLEGELEKWLQWGRGHVEGRREWCPDRSGHLETEFGKLVPLVSGLVEHLSEAGDRGRLLDQCRARGEVLEGNVRFFADPEGVETQVRWLERRGRSMILHATPLDMAGILQKVLFTAVPAVILTSATLAVGGDFAALEQSLGLSGSVCLVADSPFEYGRQTLLYLPEGLPAPADPGYVRQCVDAAVPVIRASEGRSFFLFTSHRALREAAALLRDRLEYPLLVQGEMPRPRLLEQFRRAGNAVLLGAASFWEGVDVQGAGLSTVIIDKLPFASPGDPVLQARMERILAQGGDPFLVLQVPQAVMALRQGVGRLIRSESDRGVLMICDPRLRSRGYGRIFMRSLPSMPVTCNLSDVRIFWEKDLDENLARN